MVSIMIAYMPERKQLFTDVYHSWTSVLLVCAITGLIANILIFYPGYLSKDSTSQLCQAVELCPLESWHPPAMTLLWRGLIALTGHISSMLIFQLNILWTGLFLVSLYIWAQTRRKYLSLGVLLFGYSPMIVNISGVIWKDVQAAAALLLSVALLLACRRAAGIRTRAATGAFALLLMLYAAMVRYNAILFVVPLLYIWVVEMKITAKYRLTIFISLIIMLATAPYAVNKLSGAASKPYIDTYTMTGDIINMLSPQEIARSKLSNNAMSALLDFSDCADSDARINRAFNACGSEQSRQYLMFNDHEALRSLWLVAIMRNPIEFILYKINSYTIFLFPGDDQAVWQDGMYQGSHPVASLKSHDAKDALSHYVNNFGFRHFSFLYAAWFWLVLGVIALLRGRTLQRYSMYVCLLAASAVLNILSYFPLSLTNDYRYIYWSVFACGLAYLLLYTELKVQNCEGRKSAVSTRKKLATAKK